MDASILTFVNHGCSSTHNIELSINHIRATSIFDPASDRHLHHINDGFHIFIHALLIALASQLEYYFSAMNLRRDTYLHTIMGLNSGFVPTTVLATFANVSRIVAQHDMDGSLLSDELDVPTLIRKAALENSQFSRCRRVRH